MAMAATMKTGEERYCSPQVGTEEVAVMMIDKKMKNIMGCEKHAIFIVSYWIGGLRLSNTPD